MDVMAALGLARALLREHVLTGWRVSLDRAKTRAGACHFGSRTITLSRPLTRLHSEAEVRDTILHEIAHAARLPLQVHRRAGIGCGVLKELCTVVLLGVLEKRLVFCASRPGRFRERRCQATCHLKPRPQPR